MSGMFDTPLRSAALGILIVASLVLIRGVFFARPLKTSVLSLMILALSMVLISEGLR